MLACWQKFTKIIRIKIGQKVHRRKIGLKKKNTSKSENIPDHSFCNFLVQWGEIYDLFCVQTVNTESRKNG